MSNSPRFPKILAIGGAHIDRRGLMTADFIPGASIPGTMQEDVGGGAFNAIRTAARMGAVATMMSVRGGDAAGVTVADAFLSDGIRDESVVFLDRTTPSYTALLDRNGDVVAALADMALYELAFAKQMRRAKMRELVSANDALLVDANLTENALARLVALAGSAPIFAIAISPAKAVRLRDLLPRLSCLFMNKREAAALAGLEPSVSDLRPSDLPLALSRLGLARGVITSGQDSVVSWDQHGAYDMRPPSSSKVADVTGAGDALAGAAMLGLLAGKSMPEAVRDGMAAALLAVESPSAVPPIDPKRLAAALALVPAYA